jgi:hypothetical protein
MFPKDWQTQARQGGRVMAMGTGLLALAMVAADGPSGPAVETTTYQVRVLTMDGLDWRTSSYSRLQSVTHQGTSSIWTADRTLAASLADRAKGATPCHTIMAIGEAAMTKADSVNYIAAIDRVADGPINQSSAIAFVPRPEQIEERFALRVAGRKLDQGILTKIAIEETHVDVIHGVPQSETLIPVSTKGAKPAESTASESRTAIAASVQVPEISRASIAGEWLIPNDGVLIISLGVKTAADDQGKAVVRERIAIVEAHSASRTPDGTPRVPMTSPVAAASFEPTKLGPPIVPGRSMPQQVDPEGNVLELPPLPEALASADLDRIKPEPYQPSAQTKIQSAPAADPALARTSFDAPPPAPRNPAEAKDAPTEGDSISLSEVIDGLTKAGVKLVVDVDPKATPKLLKVDSEECPADATVCPATAGSIKPGQVAGGMKLAPGGWSVIQAVKNASMGVVIRDADGSQVADTGIKMLEVFKTPGKTETTFIPFPGPFSLEVKATLVPNPSDQSKTAAKVGESPTSKR